MANRIGHAFCHPARVTYLGIWDAVSSVGVIRLLTLPQTSKLESVDHVRHAVALEELRNMFPENLISLAENHEECWFAGVHRDVGGGGADGKLGLSMIPFWWVLERALAPDIGLRIDASRREKLYEVPRDPFGRDNQNYWIVAAFAVVGLIPMRWWSKDRNWWAFWRAHRPGFKWKWPNLIHVRRPSPSAIMDASVRQRKDAKRAISSKK
jgi:Uncharacterized alpha/beta hydrolase domain (DUF2235)